MPIYVRSIEMSRMPYPTKGRLLKPKRRRFFAIFARRPSG